MSKMGEKNDVEWCVRFGRWVVLFSISFIFFSTPVFSKNNIPNVCIPRGVELGILNPSSTSTKPLLQKNAYDVVPTVEKYYHQTLDRLKDEVQDEESQIFSYLMKCAASKNGRECHHFYKQKNNDPDFYIENNIFYLDTYCAPQIAQFVVQTAVTTTEKMQEQCSTQPEFIEADDEGGFPENAIPDCFGRDTISGASYWTNKLLNMNRDWKIYDRAHPMPTLFKPSNNH